MQVKDSPIVSKPGFTSRLWKLLDQFGVKERGRKRLLAVWSDLSPTAIGNILTEDRPPSNRANLDKMIDQAVSFINANSAGPRITKTALRRHLLLAEPISLSLSTEQPPKTTYQQLDVVKQGRLHVAIMEAGKAININVFKEIQKSDLMRLLDKAAQLHSGMKIEIDSGEMSEILRALIKASVT